MWNDDWRMELEREYEIIFERLAECRNTKHDILVMAKLMYDYNKEHKTAEECLDRMLEWVCIWNNQYGLMMIDEEYNKILKKIK